MERLSDIEIAQSVTPLPVERIAAELGLTPEEIELYGRYKAKVDLSVFDRLRDRPDGKQMCIRDSVYPGHPARAAGAGTQCLYQHPGPGHDEHAYRPARCRDEHRSRSDSDLRLRHGGEMCIRDRHCAAGPSAESHCRYGGSGRTAASGSRRDGERPHCPSSVSIPDHPARP